MKSILLEACLFLIREKEEVSMDSEEGGNNNAKAT